MGVEPACAACPRKITRLRSTPTVPSTVPTGRPETLEHGPLLDVQLEVGAHVPEAASPPRERGRDRRRARPARPRAVIRRRRAGRARSSGSSVPATAEEPSRLRPKRAPSSSAQSTSVTVQGGVPASASVRSVSSAAMTPSAPSSQPPFGTESMCEPITTVSGRSPARRAQRLPASSTSTSTGSSASARAGARARSPTRPSRPAGAHRRGRRSARPAHAGRRSRAAADT